MSATSIRLEGPNVVYRDCFSTTGGLVWILSKDGGSIPPPAPAPPPAGQFSCTASVNASEPSATTLVTFDEPEIDTVRTITASEGTYASCPYRYSDTLSQFSVKGVSMQGRYTFRGLWNGCTSSNPSVWDGGVLQMRDSNLTLGLNVRPTTLRFSLGVDGSYPSPRFDLSVTDGTGATVSTTATTLLGKVSLSCTSPISTVRISHDGPGWIVDSVAF